MNLKCELIACSDTEHLQQIYTGFSLLHRRGIINLKQTIPSEFLQNKSLPDRWLDYKFFNAKVVVNDEITVCYDTHDWNWIDEEILNTVDFYFKRSYDRDFLSGLREKDKVYPLGLNYQVASDQPDFFRLRRAAFYDGRDKIKHIVKSLRLDKFLANKEVSQLGSLQAAPDFSLEPRVLFMARAWNTEALPDSSQKEKVNQINQMRAACIRVLRKEFGERFYGGLMRDDFAQKHFKDVILPDDEISNKRNYIEMLRNFPICVATTGLNNSIGWKFAEYVAFSKAIVSEPLHFQVTGDFAENKNYLTFSEPQELLSSVAELFEDKTRRQTLMKNNSEYYKKFVSPEMLVLNTLEIVGNHSGFSFP